MTRLAEITLVAECAALLVFANAAREVIMRTPCEELRHPLERLWRELETKYEMFFGEPTERDRPG
jgi:hypothetical protein